MALVLSRFLQVVLMTGLAILVAACSEPVPARPDPGRYTGARAAAPDARPLPGGRIIHCRGRSQDLVKQVRQIARNLEARRIMYNGDGRKLEDCSGIFHQVLIEIARDCPGVEMPVPSAYRSTRDLARWYRERGDFIVIRNPARASDLIRPGAVLFYGQSGRNYTNVSTGDLLRRGTGIEHMGVVMTVDKDAAGRVTSYRLFHGRSSGKIAKTTNYHRLVPSRKSYPPYGNGSQPLVAVAPAVINSRFR